MLLICVESGKIPLLRKVKQLFKCLRVWVLIDIVYIAKYKLYKMASLFLVYGLWSRDESALLGDHAYYEQSSQCSGDTQ